MWQCRWLVGWTAVLSLALAASARAQSSHSHGHPSHFGGSHHTPGGKGTQHGGNGHPYPVHPGPILYQPPPIIVVWNPWIGYPYAYGSPGVVTTPPLTQTILPVFPLAGQTAPVFPAIPQVVNHPAMNPAPRPRNRDTTRAKELTELGDRLFRAGNYVRAVERYEQAIRANPDRAEPRARLAQVALVRGKYQDAANKLREAQTAEPGWLAAAGDLQGVFPEPAVFERHVATLEAHLQAKPEDRDAWLVLGSLWYLSGRTQKASDIFLRLSDRQEDPTLRAFLQATKAERQP